MPVPSVVFAAVAAVGLATTLLIWPLLSLTWLPGPPALHWEARSDGLVGEDGDDDAGEEAS
jgi:hypothetical protein